MHLTLLCLCRCPVSGLQWGPSENKTRLLCCSSWTDLNVFRMHNFALLMLPNIHIRRRWCTLHRHHYCPDGFNGAAGLFFFFPEVLKWCTLTLMCYWMGPGIVFCLFSIMPLSMRPISSLENVLQKRGRCLQKEKKKEREKPCELTIFMPGLRGNVHFKGRQSSCNYSGTWANGSEESTQKTVYTVNILSQVPRWTGQV